MKFSNEKIQFSLVIKLILSNYDINAIQCALKNAYPIPPTCL